MRVALYVPCYNGAAWLRDCLDALLGQTRPADEVAVVDDGSTDDSAAIVRSYGARVRLISHGRNRGLAVARNTALGEIECDVLASVDADVRATPAWLERQLCGFDSPRTAAVGGKLIEAHQTRLPDRWRAAHMPQHAGDFPQRNPPVLPGANVAVRRDVVRSLGGYDESFRTNYEDADLQHRLIERGYHCRYVPDAEAYHLRTDTAQSVLRTYWGWLRPPAERAGRFASLAGLAARRKELTDITQRALWQDFADGAPELSYLSLLVALLFPLADARYAGSELAHEGGSWQQALLSSEVAAVRAAASDAARLAWWDRARPGGSASEAHRDATPELHNMLSAIPAAWWPGLNQARERTAAEEAWPALPPEPAPPPSPDPEVIAVIEHGQAGETRWLTVMRTWPPALAGHTKHPTQAIAAHRIGWLPPSPLQQSLLWTGRTVAGDPAALAAVPPWRPDPVDPIAGLDDASAQRRLRDWLLVWEREGPSEKVVERFRALREQARLPA